MSNSLSAVHPELVTKWSEKNLPLTPDSITFGSNRKEWWKGACGHEWKTSVKARSNCEKCPMHSSRHTTESSRSFSRRAHSMNMPKMLSLKCIRPPMFPIRITSVKYGSRSMKRRNFTLS